MQIIEKIKSSSLLTTTGVYTITNIINASIPFFMIPVLTRYLTREDYGIVAMYTLLVSFVSPFVGLSIHGAISRRYFDPERGDFAKYVGSCFFLLFTSTAVVCLIFIFARHLISDVTGIPAKWVFSTVLYSFFQFIILCLLTIYQVKTKPFPYGIYQITQTLLNCSLSIVFVVMMNRGWEGRIEGQIITLFLFGIISFCVLVHKKWLVFKIDREDIRHALRFSLPLIPHTIGGILISMTDRFFITNMEGLEKTGVFMVAFQLGNVINLMVTSFNNAYVPWLFGKLKTADEIVKKQIVRLTYSFFGVFILIPLVSYLLLPWLLSFFVGESFVGVEHYAIWLIMGYCFNGMYVLTVNFIFYAQKTHFLPIITFSTALINIPVCYFLIRWNGAEGAAQSTAIIYLATFIGTWALSARVYRMPWLSAFSNTGNSNKAI